MKLGPDGSPSDMRIFRCKTGTVQFTFRCDEYSGAKLGPDGSPSHVRIFRCKTGTLMVYLQI